MKQLRCRECGRLRDFEPAYVCEHCFGPLEVAYDLAAVRERVSRESIAKGPNTIWRYRELLPAPTGEPFSLYIRAYWPDDVLLGGRWQPPVVAQTA